MLVRMICKKRKMKTGAFLGSWETAEKPDASPKFQFT